MDRAILPHFQNDRSLPERVVDGTDRKGESHERLAGTDQRVDLAQQTEPDSLPPPARKPPHHEMELPHEATQGSERRPSECNERRRDGLRSQAGALHLPELQCHEKGEGGLTDLVLGGSALTLPPK